jgi:GntR family transcriptional regulator
MADAKYRQIADDLRTKIESRELGPGAQLPTELDLRTKYGTSRNTVREAIKGLAGLGLVEPRAGAGTFVLGKIEPYDTTLSHGGGEGDKFIEEVAAAHRQPSVKSPEVGIAKAQGNVAAYLEITPDAKVVRREQERFIDGSPWSLQTSFYPWTIASIADRLTEPEDIREGAVSYLAAKIGIKQVGYRDFITVRGPNKRETEFFGLRDPRVQVFEIFRVAFDDSGKPIRLTVTVYPSDRNRFVIDSGDVPSRAS